MLAKILISAPALVLSTTLVFGQIVQQNSSQPQSAEVTEDGAEPEDIMPREPVDPPEAVTENYIPPEYLDRDFLAVQVRRAEDRILVLEETQEELVNRYNSLAEKYNQLIEVLQGPEEANADN